MVFCILQSFCFSFLFLGGIQTNIHICAKIYNIIYIYSFFCFVLSSLVCKKSAILKEKKTEKPRLFKSDKCYCSDRKDELLSLCFTPSPTRVFIFIIHLTSTKIHLEPECLY